MEFKGTKGEWKVASNNIYCEGKHIAITLKHDFKWNSKGRIIEDDRIYHNAKLIASAPDLLELCLLVYNSFGGGNVITFSEKDIEDFKQAIEKALK